jgi:hypothetical protein
MKAHVRREACLIDVYETLLMFDVRASDVRSLTELDQRF